MREGDPVEVTDGKGSLAFCIVRQVTKKAVVLDVTGSSTIAQPARRLFMAVAPTKNMDRFEWFVEKATELGVSSIIPVWCDHSERRKMGMDRVRKLVVSAAKQSGQVWFPECREPVELGEILRLPFEGNRFMAHCRDGVKVPARDLGSVPSALVVIGPEGDFSGRETELAHSLGFTSLSLGENRLRTETAALAAVMAFHLAEPLSKT
jgi:16S rRNA (uracil1498-N3)-methyltransferase